LAPKESIVVPGYQRGTSQIPKSSPTLPRCESKRLIAKGAIVDVDDDVGEG
jgi:hypothetical protein